MEMLPTRFAVLDQIGAPRGGVHLVPPGFSFPGITDDIPINPSIKKFETQRDAIGWLLFAGVDWLRTQLNARPKAPFHWHNHPAYQGRRFIYDEDTRLFMLNANHEMMSGGYPYFDYIDAKKASYPHTQEQEGSYFCLRSSRFQLVGIDTDYHKHSRLQEPELVAWLGQILRDGKRDGRTNILLSSNEPYEYGRTELKPLLAEDLVGFAREQLIDLWFWGNTHYCAFFHESPHTPFLGSCIGHGGYPYSKISSGRRSPAPVGFVETLARFPAWTELTQDRGNNGYCVLRLKADGSVGLNYIDWMSTLRCEATLTKANRQDRLTVVNVQVYDR